MASRTVSTLGRLARGGLLRNTAIRMPVRIGQVASVVPQRAFGITAVSDEATGAIQDAHRSNSQELISKVEVIQVEKEVALCDGGGGALGHPLEYIQVTEHTPSICKYCGLRYQMKPHH